MSENGNTTELSPGQIALERFNTVREHARSLKNRVRLKFLGSAGLAGSAVSGALYMFSSGEVPDWAIAAEGFAAAGSIALFGSAQLDLVKLARTDRTAAHLSKSLTVRQLAERDTSKNGDIHPKEVEAQRKLDNLRAQRHDVSPEL